MFSLAKRSLVSKISTRSFSSIPARKNVISDLYVKELKGFKPTPLTAQDAEGSVKPWKAPAAPRTPGLEADAATQLNEYESAPVEVDSAPVANEGATESTGEDDWFVLEEDPVEENHH
ncbi:ATP synthase subunit H, mitochondrial [Wickerhamomyces ciferrii]|uniref:ATP synthase subunit H, mitochondrial n=1 Tax=Wickerhamomyces ciferrii (strain ATCC 14091 / BCRC 22168 / CBS 111 / JCM 3599 / NBRC 0793 / NRRL Y-1031 F-60-10) TaxID=1206466 RepID=K0KSB5_WICCF|nr:ATP synthase subunit H, mitochondrial [Wickerhamomyces ciferrii]CCH44897.1 ATP synthase subunit H, mitochondrial [Wickerhamomyces ciferrii]